MLMKPLFEYGLHFVDYVAEYVGRHALDPTCVSGHEIQRSWLIAPNNTRCIGAATHQRYGEPRDPGEVRSAADRHNDRHPHPVIELISRDDKHRTGTLLFMPESWIERNNINVA